MTDTTTQAPGPDFANQKEVLTYLQGAGYKIGKSALSNHVRARLLKKKKGVFARPDVESYAQLHLAAADSGQRPAEKKTNDLQERKLRASIMRDEEQGLKAKMEREALEGKLLPRAAAEMELAARAAVLDSGLRGLIRADTAAWVELVAGDQARTGELIEQILGRLDQFFDQYATTTTFVVELAAGQEHRQL